MRYIKYVLLAIPFSFLYFLPHQKETKGESFSCSPSLQYADDSLRIDLSNYKKKDKLYVINDTIDLQGKTWYLLEGSTLNIKGGLLRNGAVAGSKTTLQYKGIVFDHVNIKGTWLVPEIRTSMFSDLSYENSLKDVFALACPEINNTILIETGIYYLTALKNYDNCLCLVSNEDVIIKGTIILTPNSFEEYSIFFINGDNVTLNGNGSIIGDKKSHLGNSGEWGMGVYIHNSDNVIVSGITVRDCWGDCVYIGGGSENILIENCTLDNGRRQGISVTSATNVRIRNCYISNVEGASPQYAIDLEPNAGDFVGNVFIDNVNAFNCQGGIMSYGRAKDAGIGVIKVSNCILEGSKLCPLYFEKGKSVTVERCVLKDNDANYMIVCNDVDVAKVVNNTIVTNNKRLSLDKTISVNNYRTRKVRNNIMKKKVEYERD